MPGRAVIVYVGGGRASGEESPHEGLIRNVKVDVRLVGGDGTLQEARGRLPGFVWWLLEEGQEIAVRVDPATGAVIGYDRSALEAEFTPRIGELKQARKRETSMRYVFGVERTKWRTFRRRDAGQLCSRSGRHG